MRRIVTGQAGLGAAFLVAIGGLFALGCQPPASADAGRPDAEQDGAAHDAAGSDSAQVESGNTDATSADTFSLDGAVNDLGATADV